MSPLIQGLNYRSACDGYMGVLGWREDTSDAVVVSLYEKQII